MTETGKLRIMLVDDSAETREYLRKLLQFESHLELAGMAANGQEAVDLALKVKPDLILMDINMPVMDGISAAEIIFREIPSVRVVMMSVQSEMAYLRRAMQVGAREFLIKPFTHDELLNIIGEVGSLAPAAAETVTGVPASAMVDARGKPITEGTLVTVFSPRGGAGCSTVALNLAIALQGQRKAQVLLIDANLRFGALDAMLNLQISRSIADVVRALADADAELLQLNTLPHSTGVRLLAAPPSPEMADLVTVQHVEQIVALAQRHFDYIVVDLGSRLDDRALSIMDAASRIFVLLVPDIPAIKNVRLFLGVANSLEYESEKISLVLNRANPRGGINAEAIERHLKQPIVASIPDSPRVAQIAINRGVPLMFFEREVDKGMPVTSQLLALAKMVPEPGVAVAEAVAEQAEVRMREAVPAVGPMSQDQRGGILGRLFKRSS
jgi:pilus assembly protein CpaE